MFFNLKQKKRYKIINNETSLKTNYSSEKLLRGEMLYNKLIIIICSAFQGFIMLYNTE